MKVDVILGLQWGDEGKGKMIDVLCPNYDVVARYQGGPNAGHTIIFDDKKIVLHTLPSGFCRPNCINVIGNGVVINPYILRQEVQKLTQVLGQPESEILKRLVVSTKASLILPTHPMLDQYQEQEKGASKIGSTLKGIGPCYTDKTARAAIQVGQIFDKDFDQQVDARMAQHLKQMNGATLSAEQKNNWNDSIAWMRSLHITNTETFIQQHLAQGKRILAEGAQGAMLDVNFGTYPYVTSSTTTTSGVCQGLGIAPQQVGKVFGVFKAYTTRVGEGPFPTELTESIGQHLREKGSEFGSTTGRPRRCGWLDMPLLRYAVMINGVTDLMMMKVDVLSELEQIEVADTYQVDAKVYEVAETDRAFLSKAQIHYRSFKGWSNVPDSQMIESQAFRDYVAYIEQKTNVPVTFVSYGAHRDDVKIKA